MGNYRIAKVNEGALEARRQSSWELSITPLNIIANLALTHMNQGRWDKAEKLQAKEPKRCSRVLGTEHP